MSGPGREARVDRGRGSRVADFARGRRSRGAGRRPPATLPTLVKTRGFEEEGDPAKNRRLRAEFATGLPRSRRTAAQPLTASAQARAAGGSGPRQYGTAAAAAAAAARKITRAGESRSDDETQAHVPAAPKPAGQVERRGRRVAARGSHGQPVSSLGLPARVRALPSQLTARGHAIAAMIGQQRGEAVIGSARFSRGSLRDEASGGGAGIAEPGFPPPAAAAGGKGGGGGLNSRRGAGRHDTGRTTADQARVAMRLHLRLGPA